ncbi:MAG: type 4a pilus biogenesis protein PilO [Planctomycetes bacterium]|nr:type 4a pilus biogenesis protein PilO [Planctomycetota bacterium]
MKFGIRELLLLGVLLAMPVCAWWFVFRPVNTEINKARSEIAQKERTLEKLSLATKQSADLAKANAEVASAIGLIESRLPTGKEVDKILEQVANLARQSNLEIPRVKAQKPVAASKYMEQPLDMSIVGDFDDFYNFLLKLEQLDRITRLLNLKLSRQDKSDGAMEAKFTLSIYFEPEVPGAGPALKTAGVDAAKGDAK